MSRPATLNIAPSSRPPPETPDVNTASIPTVDGSQSQHTSARNPHFPSISHTASAPAASIEATEHCTCPPEHKIPRPENCFILFRSAHQKQLSTTGNNNQPGISVKLGDLWKNADSATKEYWKAEAEKKKALHRQRYPNYKYQPKSRNKSLRSADEAFCNNCGKRLIGVQPSPDSPPLSASPSTAATEFPRTSASLDSFQGSEKAKSTAMPALDETRLYQSHTRFDDLPGPLRAVSVPSRLKRTSNLTLTTSTGAYQQDPKRRRLVNAEDASYSSSTHTVMTPTTAHSGLPTSPTHQRLPLSTQTRRQTAPSIHSTATGNQSPHDPRPHTNLIQWASNRSHPPVSSRPLLHPPSTTPSPRTLTPHQSQFNQHLPGIAEVIRSPLPPKPSMPPPMRRFSTKEDGKNFRLAPLQSSGSSDGKNDEAIATNLPFTDKIKRLAKVAPPLRAGELSSSPPKVRGVLIAVEGDDSDAAHALAKLLAASLHKEESDFKTRLEVGFTAGKPNAAEFTLEDSLEAALRWHRKNKDMVEYLTSTQTTGEPLQAATNSKAMPVLIVPNYQLRITDLHASRIPIADGYSPDEHYDHMASLWRGIVGPDLTIYLRDVPGEQLKKEVVHVIHDYNAMRIAKERGSQKVDEERIRAMRYQVGAFIRRMAGPVREIDLGRRSDDEQ